ncbi:glycine--tRNA ligase subunit alpha [Escherichia coli]|nr:glycine--tRNA ligase subunit alpha [Escherichia coli]
MPGDWAGKLWLNGMEVTQFLLPAGWWSGCKPVTGEITYGLERLAMYISGRRRLRPGLERRPLGKTTYGDVFHQTKVE